MNAGVNVRLSTFNIGLFCEFVMITIFCPEIRDKIPYYTVIIGQKFSTC